MQAQQNAVRGRPAIRLEVVVLEDLQHASVFRCDLGNHLLDTPLLAHVQAVVGQHGAQAHALPGVADQDRVLGLSVVRVGDQPADADQLALRPPSISATIAISRS